MATARVLPVTIRVRTYHSRNHIQAAAYLARQASVLEAPAEFPRLGFTEHRACVTAAVLSSFAFLEATINEVLGDAADGVGPATKELPANVVAAIQNVGNLESVDRLTVLDKYQLVLVCAGCPQLPSDRQPFQDVAVLVHLRNALVHPRPSQFEVGESGPTADRIANRLERKLKGKFPLNPAFTGASNAFFPDQCLGHGCAEWAVLSAVAFTDEFFAHMGMNATHDAVRGSLQTR